MEDAPQQERLSPNGLRDRHIRPALVAYLQAKDPTAAIFHELPLSRGESRADVACVNGVLAGFEIKSAVDSLSRLEVQLGHYRAVFEQMTAVVAPRHLASVRAMVPQTWGIMVALAAPTGIVALRSVRGARRNRELEADALARLLWKPECVRLLRRSGMSVDRDAPVLELWRLLQELPGEELCAGVREALRARGGSVAGGSRT